MSVKGEAEIAVFGGTGIYDSGIITNAEEINMSTPYGDPSGSITLGTFEGKRVAFLPRHGKDHSIPPHMINYRANIWAFQKIGVQRIISPSAVGSLREEIAPGDFVLPSQFIDFTKMRASSFSDIGRVIHISVADPFCPQMQDVALKAGAAQNVKMHQNVTYVCIEGPRFSTRAESEFFRSTGGGIIGMTLSPECQLAREARICYMSVSTVTDYDVWAQKPVTAKEVLSVISENARNVKTMLSGMIREIPRERICKCKDALSEAEF